MTPDEARAALQNAGTPDHLAEEARGVLAAEAKADDDFEAKFVASEHEREKLGVLIAEQEAEITEYQKMLGAADEVITNLKQECESAAALVAELRKPTTVPASAATSTKR